MPAAAPTEPKSSPSSNGRFAADLFATHLASLSQSPKWWLDLKREAWNRFVSLPLPARTDELWRFSNTAGLQLDGCVFPATAPVALDSGRWSLSFPRAAELVFANNRLASVSLLPAELAARGVIFTSLEDVLIKHADLVYRYFQVQAANLGADKFAALNAALTTSGAFLYVPPGVEISEPLVVTHTVAGAGSAVFPHTIVIAGENSKVTLVEYFLSADSAPGLASGVNDLHAGPGAQLTYIGAQNWSRNMLSFQSNATTVRRDARVLSLNVHLGARQARHESHSRLQGTGAHSEMLALTVAQAEQEFDQRTLQSHQAPRTGSNLLYKNALLDQARTIFSGLIVVDPDAQKTDAYQSNRNLMLSSEAQANSLPGLEIQANDVRCTHGATTSHVDDEQLFYLKSRGIRPAPARELLVFGFFEEVIEKLDNKELQAALRSLIQAKFKK
ncbi:MAG: Fe-S cluster assembly protein SufD [Opitutaceae bacterium]|jgi:Fe-S cluster assembly protein SufD